MMDPHMFGAVSRSIVDLSTYNAGINNSLKKIINVTLVGDNVIGQEAHKVILAVSS